MQNDNQKNPTVLFTLKILDLSIGFLTTSIAHLLVGSVLSLVTIVYGISLLQEEIVNDLWVMNIALFSLLCIYFFAVVLKEMFFKKPNFRSVWNNFLVLVAYLAVTINIEKNEIFKNHSNLSEAGDIIVSGAIGVVLLLGMYKLWKSLFPNIIIRMILKRDTLGLDRKLARESTGLTKFGEYTKGTFLTFTLVQVLQGLLIKEEYKETVFIRKIERNEEIETGLITEVTSKAVEQEKFHQFTHYNIQFSFKLFKDLYFDILWLENISVYWNGGLAHATKEPTIALANKVVVKVEDEMNEQ